MPRILKSFLKSKTLFTSFLLLFSFQILAKTNEELLIEAITRAKKETVKELIEKGVNVNAQDSLSGETPSIIAIKWRQLEILQDLLKAGADVNGKDRNGNAPLHVLVRKVPSKPIRSMSGSVDILKELLKQKDTDYNIQDNDGKTAVFIAAELGHIEYLRELFKLKEKVNVNITDNTGQSPLIKTLKFFKFESAKFLIEEAPGLNVNALSGLSLKTTALILATKSLNKDMIPIAKLLINHKDIDPNVIDDLGETALTVAVKKNNFEVVRELVRNKKTQINLANLNGNAPLHVASEYGKLESAVELLKASRLNMDLKNSNGSSALMLVSYHGFEELAIELLKRDDLTVDLKNASGETAYEIAKKRLNEEVVLAIEFRLAKDQKNREVQTSLK